MVEAGKEQIPDRTVGQVNDTCLRENAYPIRTGCEWRAEVPTEACITLCKMSAYADTGLLVRREKRFQNILDRWYQIWSLPELRQDRLYSRRQCCAASAVMQIQAASFKGR